MQVVVSCMCSIYSTYVRNYVMSLRFIQFHWCVVAMKGYNMFMSSLLRMCLSVQVSSLQLRLSAAQQAESCEWHAAQALLQSTLSEVRAQVTDAGTGALVGRVGELQAQLLQCQKENMELRFELEQAITSVPRMKVCVGGGDHMYALTYLSVVDLRTLSL